PRTARRSPKSRSRKAESAFPSTACSSVTRATMARTPTSTAAALTTPATTAAPVPERPQDGAKRNTAKQVRRTTSAVRATTREMRVASRRLARPPLHHDPELLHPAVERLAAQAQRFRRPGDAPLGVAESGLDPRPLHRHCLPGPMRGLEAEV